MCEIKREKIAQEPKENRKTWKEGEQKLKAKLNVPIKLSKKKGNFK